MRGAGHVARIGEWEMRNSHH